MLTVWIKHGKLHCTQRALGTNHKVVELTYVWINHDLFEIGVLHCRTTYRSFLVLSIMLGLGAMLYVTSPRLVCRIPSGMLRQYVLLLIPSSCFICSHLCYLSKECLWKVYNFSSPVILHLFSALPHFLFPSQAQLKLLYIFDIQLLCHASQWWKIFLHNSLLLEK